MGFLWAKGLRESVFCALRGSMISLFACHGMDNAQLSFWFRRLLMYVAESAYVRSRRTLYFHWAGAKLSSEVSYIERINTN